MPLRNRNIRISIVDDDEDDYLIISDYIKNIPNTSVTLHWCNNYNSALDDIINKKHDLYFVDYRLDAKSGVDLLEQALQHKCEEPIILLTGHSNYDIDIKAMQLGAIDYLIKAELNIEKLGRSIRYALDRAATLKALRANENKLRRIFEKSKDIVFIADQELNIIEVNEAIKSILGYTPYEAAKVNLVNIVDQAQHKKYLKQILQANLEIEDWEVVLVTKEGDKKVCIMNISKELNPHGDIYFQGMIHDITTLRKVEKANLRAEKLAVADRLMHTLAHEVRNPLNNISLSVEQMAHDINDEMSLSYIDIIKRNTKRINDLITELLNTSNPVEMDLQPELLQAIFDDVIAAALDRIKLNNMQLEVNYLDEEIIILADRKKLVIALLNIIINAIEAMEKDKGILSVHMFAKDTHAIIAIKDNGCGISEENIKRLFEPYFTQKRNGVGLGLASTLNILKAHNADIEVSSAPGEGTLFTVSLPLSAAAG